MKITGLTQEEVKRSREKHGSNAIPEAPPATFWKEFAATFGDPMIKLLLVIAGIMLAMFFLGYSQIYEPLGTLVAIFLVAVVTARTGVASDSKYRELKNRTEKEQCKVYRDGSVRLLDADEIVVGDCVLLHAGDKIPADGLLRTGSLLVDNSAMNGESEECPKSPAEKDAVFSDEITGDSFVDRHSLFRGTVVLDGQGVLEVCRVGLSTMMGKMAQEMQGEEPMSPLKVKLSKLAGQISRFGYVGAITIAILYFIHFILVAGGPGVYFTAAPQVILQDLVHAVSLAVVIIVCAVPEGLPLMISIVLMQNTSKMLDHNVLVRKAEGIETAGSLNILFSDKTGTITKGKLEVVDFFLGDGESLDEQQLEQSAIRPLLDVAIGKNTQSLFDGEHRVLGGNVTDQALLRFLGEARYLALKENAALAADAAQDFNSTNKFSQVHIASLGRTFYKGAPERLLEHAKYYLNQRGEQCPLDREKLDRKIDGLAKKAMRELAFGYSEAALEKDRIHEDLVLLGLVAIRDDVRAEARDAIEQMQQAGIQVVMITGDRLETAAAIARDAGLLQAEDQLALTSAQLNGMSDEEVKQCIPRLRVIARALPTDKSRMVRLCQELGLVVGMTGDGVNDSPALKRADVGFAMGSGTEAAREAGKIVILDDNFRSIKDAVWYGRTIYHNILKFCTFQLVINVTAVLVSAIAPFFGVDEPLKVTHLLFVNLVMDGLGAIMLGNEPAQACYMTEPPRRREESIISRSMMAQILVMGAWMSCLSFIYLLHPFFRSLFSSEAAHLTGYFVLFIAAALFNGFNVRDDGFGIFRNLRANPGFMRVFVLILLVQAALVNVPLLPGTVFRWIGNMFSCVPFSPAAWGVVLLLAFTMVPVDLLRKAIVRKIRSV